jgi:hypothetical protein
MGLQDLGGNADGVQGLVQVEGPAEPGVAVGDQGYSLTQSWTPRLRLAGVVSDLIR